MSYEQSFKKVEQIISQLSDNDIELDKAVELYKNGIDELKKCTDALDKAKLIISEVENSDEQ